MSPADFVSEAAAPAVPVAVKVTAVRLATEALSAFRPAVVPRVHEPTVAIPDASVATDALLTEPPPLSTRKLTVAPAMGAPFWSLTSTDGAGETGLPATPESDVLEFAVIVVATEGSAVFSLVQATYASRTVTELSLNAVRLDRVT